MYLLTEGGRSFKTLLKENYAIALDSCYLFTKMLSMGLNMIYIDSTYGDIRLSQKLEQI